MEPKREPKTENLTISPEIEEAKDKDELSEEELDTVAGGKVNLQDFHFTRKVDKASPILL